MSSTAPAGNRTQLRHRLLFDALLGPAGDDRIDLGFALHAGVGCSVALVVDQILAADQLQKARPMLRIGAACRQVDVIVGAAGLTRIDAAGRVVGRRPALTAYQQRPLMAARDSVESFDPTATANF